MSEIGIQGSVKASQSPVISFSARDLIIFHNPSFLDFCFQFFKVKAVEATNEAVREAYIESLTDLNEELANSGVIDRDESFLSKRIFYHLQINQVEGLNPEELEKAFRLTSRLVVPESTFDILEALKERGYKLVVLSNDGPELVEFFKVSGLISFFDTVLLASDANALKPDPKFFKALADELELSASDLIHIGSSYARDVLFAEASGLKALLYDPQSYQSSAIKKTETETSSKVVQISKARSLNFQVFDKLSDLLNYFK